MDEVYMLELGTVINRHILGEIYKKGFSRIPVYQGERSNIVGILMAKDLILLNPDRDHYALEHLSQIFRTKVIIESTLDCLHALDTFTDTKSHMAIVCDVNREVNSTDPVIVYRGIVTLEDIVELLLAQNIEDEFDPQA